MSDWEREARWMRLEATGSVICPQCGEETRILKILNTPFRDSPFAKYDNGEEIIDVPYCPCRRLSEEDRARLKADRLFTDALGQCGLTYVALVNAVREASGIVGYVVAQHILTPEQIEKVQHALKQAMHTENE